MWGGCYSGDRHFGAERREEVEVPEAGEPGRDSNRHISRRASRKGTTGRGERATRGNSCWRRGGTKRSGPDE
jgi:hypothetical protein